MITASSKNEVTRSGIQSENTFTIKATSKAFDILSSGLYSDKIKAIVRELSCNAHDSHVAAGKSSTPIEVKLPTPLDPIFYVKDFGLGLSDEDVTQLYTTYFESTKTNSDDFIGQLGLGSKSPFSYASSFTVESRFNGMKCVYTCFKNEQGMPAISKMGEAQTDEINGVTVSLAVRRDDLEKFNVAARKVFMYFDPQPVISGQQNWASYAMRHTIVGSNWKIREADYYANMSNAYVVQGFVAYPVDTEIIGERLSPAARRLANTNIDLSVGIGKVEVAASREALSYDTRTIQNLVDVLEIAASEMRVSFQNEFDACKTQWEVAQLLGKFADTGSQQFREIFESMHKTQAFTWNGSPADRKVDLKLSDIHHTTIRRMNTVSRKSSAMFAWTPDSTTREMAYDISYQNLHILVDTEAKGHAQLAEFFLRGRHDATGRAPNVLIISPTSKKLYNQAEVDSLISQLGNPVVNKTADLGYTRVKVGGYKKRAVEQKMVWVGFPEREDRYGRSHSSEKFSRLCWSTETIDLDDGGFYVDVDRFSAQKNGVDITRLNELISVAEELGIVGDNFQLCGMTAQDRKLIAGDEDWVEFTDYVASEFNALNVNDILFKRCIYDMVVQQIGRGVTRTFIDCWDKRRASLTTGPLVDFFNELEVLGSQAAGIRPTIIRTAIEILHLDNSMQKQAYAVCDEWNSIVNQYEMLSMIDWDSVNNSNVDKIVKYVNAIEASKP